MLAGFLLAVSAAEGSASKDGMNAGCRMDVKSEKPDRKRIRDMVAENEAVRKRWEIVVPGGAKREVIYTNKVATHFSSEAVAAPSRSYHGLYCAMHEYLDSWDLKLGSRILSADGITKAFIYPHTMYRYYGNAGVMEEIFLPDERNGLVVRVSGPLEGRCAFIPWVDMRFIWRTPRPDYRVFWMKEENTLLVSRVDDPFPEGRPKWIAVTANEPLYFKFDERMERRTYWRDAARNAMAYTFPYSPGQPGFEAADGASTQIVFSFGLGENEKDAMAEARFILNNFDSLKAAKLDRIESLLERADIETSDERINKAYRWARVSMDNLIMNQRGRGIYAGFHWFPNYWGRDTFISLPGACLDTGRFDDAREILLSFMDYQMQDTSSALLGRFPNIVNPDALQYSGVDGTWWLVRAAWKYYNATKDVDFLVRAFPQIELAINGALAKAVDRQGFLTHADHETWMDAGGSSHPYTPRGNRAVEVQALFYNGLIVGAEWAEEIARLDGSMRPQKETSVFTQNDELEKLAERWSKEAAKLKRNFNRYFWDEKGSYLYDHLRADGTPVPEIRPNAILAIWVTDGGLVSKARYKKIVHTALEKLCFSYGVTSLAPSEKGFHPYHLNPHKYFFDEAYHNGDVWEWLTGPMASCLIEAGETETAWELVRPLVTEILDEACVGTLREIRDGAYTPDKDEFGGATSQAWSLAEFIRVFSEEFIHLQGKQGLSRLQTKDDTTDSFDAEALGLRADSTRLPLEWGQTRFLEPMVLPISNWSSERRAVTVRGVVEPEKRNRKKAYELKKFTITK